MDGERQIGGLRCGEVLARLSDFLDGALAADDQVKVEAHVQGCDACARFGGAFAVAVTALRGLGTRRDVTG